MIDRFFTTTFTVKRMSWSNESSAEISKTSISGCIQQATAELAEGYRLDFTKAYSVWCTASADVEVGDTLANGSDTYSVKAIIDYLQGSNTHKELICEKDE